MAFALGAAVLTVGLVTYQAVFIVGVVLLLAAGAEWTAEAWAERASADASYNAAVRSRIANPLEFPLAAAIGIGIIVFAFSRIMLWLSKTNTVIAFAVLGIIILTVAFFLAYRPGLKSRAAFGAIAVGVLALVAGGAAAGLDGERDIHVHETTDGLSEEGAGICLSPEEFEADEKASQSVGATAAVAARITLEEDGQLTFSVNGPVEQGATALTSAALEPQQRPLHQPVRRASSPLRRSHGAARRRRRGRGRPPQVHCARRPGWQPEHHPHDRCAEHRRPRWVLLLRARCRVGPAGTDRAMSNSPLKRHPLTPRRTRGRRRARTPR
jgi:hypothetical protein